MHTASLQLPCGDADTARILLEALRMEVADGPEGSRVELTVQGGGLEVQIDAPDVSTLRAALNSVLRLLDAAQRVVGDEQAGPTPAGRLPNTRS